MATVIKLISELPVGSRQGAVVGCPETTILNLFLFLYFQGRASSETEIGRSHVLLER